MSHDHRGTPEVRFHLLLYHYGSVDMIKGSRSCAHVNSQGTLGCILWSHRKYHETKTATVFWPVCWFKIRIHSQRMMLFGVNNQPFFMKSKLMSLDMVHQGMAFTIDPLYAAEVRAYLGGHQFSKPLKTEGFYNRMSRLSRERWIHYRASRCL